MSKVMNAIKQKAIATTFYEPCIIVTGTRSVLVENVDRIYEANEMLARFKTACGEVMVWGEDLKVKSYRGTSVNVVGKIRSCEIEGRNSADEDK